MSDLAARVEEVVRKAAADCTGRMLSNPQAQTEILVAGFRFLAEEVERRGLKG